MKIILFRKGRAGVTAGLPGDRPEEEFETALGGETMMHPLGERRILVSLRGAERLGLPRQYILRRPWAADWALYGDCAVVAVNEYGRYVNVSEEDKAFAKLSILTVPVTEAG